MLLLASMKTNFYYAAFAKEIEMWDNALSKMIETLEILMLVQKKFIYFNNIFINIQEEIGQLIGDRNNFNTVRVQLVGYLNKIAQDKNAKSNLTVDHFKDSLNSMSNELDIIQKNMKKYLDKRRTDFARFYFLSDEDMFEILGKAKEPTVINKHLKKMFEGIKSLYFIEQTLNRGQVKSYNFTKMISPEGEEPEFGTEVEVSGDIIQMMKNIENAMKEKLKKSLYESYNWIQHSTNMKPQDRYEKWIKDFPGQIVLTTAQIKWTEQCYLAINNIVNQQDKGEKDKGGNEKDGKAKRNPQREYWNNTRNQWSRMLEDITKLVRKVSSDLTKLNIIALITIEVHNRELIDHLSMNANSLVSFDWLRQLRFERKEQTTDTLLVNVAQSYANFDYGFEYQGCNGRLVVTN